MWNTCRQRRNLGHIILGAIVLVLLLQVIIFTLQTLWEGSTPKAHFKVLRGKDVRKHFHTSPSLPIYDEHFCHPDATVQTDPQKLFDQMTNKFQDTESWWWIQQRITNMWPNWVATARTVTNNTTRTNRTALRILVVPGVLRATNIPQQITIQSGGPLGDLVQWADLIGALHVLGHHVVIMDNFFEATRWLHYDTIPSFLKPPGCDDPTFDLVYADIISVKVFGESVINIYRCRLRVVDAYGTQAMYNNPRYAKSHGLDVGNYGGQQLNLKQFFTFYPHTDDNSFLGFVVQTPPYNSIKKVNNMGLLYGKEPTYFQEAAEYIQTLVDLLELHATVANNSVLPSGVINHGIISTSDYHQLLHQAKFFIGVGLPLESTGVMEALAHGCIFLNPKFNQSRPYLQGKPTNRKLSSQVPYLEHVSPPHVFTIDMNNSTQIQDFIKQVKNLQIDPFVPREFTMVGFLERLNAYLVYQDFCDKKPQWPPISAMKVHTALPGISCSESCHKQGLVCENSFFKDINSIEELNRLEVHCDESSYDSALFLPAIQRNGDSSSCVLQTDTLLFSCVGSHHTYSRICPCRDALHEQTALCKQCLP